MHSSDLSLNANQVFHYDLYGGTLAILRQEASQDGDAVFSLPDNDRIWVHSLLFYIAAGKMPSDFGTPRRLNLNSDTIEMASNDLGVPTSVLYVTEDRLSDLKKVINSCYTIDSVSAVWKALGYPDVVFNGKELERGVCRNSTLPTSLLPDFEIHLKNTRGKQPLTSIKIHKFLLARRIPYYKTFFSSRFGDASGMSSTLYTEEFTGFSVWAIASFVYHEKPSLMFDCYPTLAAYITPSPIATNQSPCCASFDTSRPIPVLGVADKLMEIAKSAHYLQATDLENWAYFSLCEIAHQFQCQGRGCVEFIPHILNLLVESETTDQWVFQKGISLLAQHKSITTLWKRPLLNCKSSVLESLIEVIQNCTETEGENKRTIQLFVRLSNLRRHTSTSKKANDWDKRLVVPLMNHTTEILAEKFNYSDTINGLAVFFSEMNLSRPIGEALLERVVDNTVLREKNCRQVFEGIMELRRRLGYDVPEVEEAKMKCVAWFERNWVTLSLAPARQLSKVSPSNDRQLGFVDSQESGAQKKPTKTPAPSGQSIAALKKLPVATSTNEGNFFSAWEQSGLEELARELLVPVSDLLATTHRNKPSVDDRFKPVKTIRVGKPRIDGVASNGGSSREGISAPVSIIESVSDTAAERGSSITGSR